MRSHIIHGLVIAFLFSNSSIVSAKPIPITHCTDSSRECVVAAATAYLDGIVAHNSDNIPLAETAQRWENGINTANNAEKLRYSINNDLGIKLVRGLRELRWVVEGNQAVGFFVMDSVFPMTSTHIIERFQVENGLITEVENIFCASANRTPEPSKIPSPTNLSFICSRL
jgi:hypothetical protein